ncbi:MAG TPA: hypothetical protein VFJ62_18365 [Usitatibacter sp.]|nr:hypothetical protein [Usitatibacter sp.]
MRLAGYALTAPVNTATTTTAQRPRHARDKQASRQVTALALRRNRTCR